MIKDSEKYAAIINEIEKEHSIDGTKLDINSRVLIIDGLNTFIRSFSASPAVNDDGIHVGGIIGFLKSIRYAISRIKPTRCIIVFDGKGGTKQRKKIFPEYKEGRKVKRNLNRNVDWGLAPKNEDDSMKLQLGRLIQYLEQLPLTLISIDGTEADDVIAYITEQVLPDNKAFIMSTDQDFLQLASKRVSIWSPTKKITYDRQRIFDEFGIYPENFLTYKILCGDKSDNIDGIKGAGLKSIRKFIEPITSENKFDITDLIEYVNRSESKIKLITNIRDNVFLLKRNYLLMQLANVDLSNHHKLYIQEAIRREIPQLIKYKFSTVFIQDKLWSHIPNMESWITEFIRLDRYRVVNDN